MVDSIHVQSYVDLEFCCNEHCTYVSVIYIRWTPNLLTWVFRARSVGINPE